MIKLSWGGLRPSRLFVFIMKIRIGNDIRLSLRLNFGGKDINILSLHALLINATLRDEIETYNSNKNKFVGRFPVEPFLKEFEPNSHNVNSAGNGKYKASVYNQYNGFGVNPDWDNTPPIMDVNITEYQCEVVRTKDPSVVILPFPAIDQKRVGKYDIVVVATIADAGYTNGSRTITANYKDAFELVSDSQQDGVISPIGLEVDGVFTSSVTDTYVENGSYSGNSITLTRNDNSTVDIDVSSINDNIDAVRNSVDAVNNSITTVNNDISDVRSDVDSMLVWQN